MKIKVKVVRVPRVRAIEIACNHNCISKEIASSYTDSELEEVLKHASGRIYKLVR